MDSGSEKAAAAVEEDATGAEADTGTGSIVGAAFSLRLLFVGFQLFAFLFRLPGLPCLFSSAAGSSTM